MELTKLITKGESETLEFKPSLSQRDKICKALSGFSNTKGGTILVGISDNGRVIGIDIGRKTLEDLAGYVKENTDPSIFPSIKQVEINKKKIIAITVEESKEKPVFFKDKAYKRVGKSTHRILSSELRRLARESGTKVYWDEQACKEATLEDIDEEKVRWFLEKTRGERRLNVESNIPLKEALERLNLLSDGKLTNTTFLMFGTKPQKYFLQAEVRCARFKGTKAVKPFLDMKVILGSIYEQVDEAEKFVLNNIRKAAWTVPGRVEREERWEYPPDAIREAITNAIAHRDYCSTANVHVSIFDDRIEVWNPGNLPEPLTPDDLKKTHKSIPVNPLLASTLFLIKYIEKWGSGTNDIVKWCLDYKLPEPIFREETGGFAVILRKTKILEDLEDLGLNERQKMAVEYIKEHGRITNRDYQGLCEGISRKTLARDLQELISKGVVERRGKKKGVYYVFK